MPSEKNSPRRFLVEPRQFGRSRRARWYASTRDPSERRELAAAYWQHVVVCKVNEELDKPIFKGNVSAFARELGLTDTSGLRKKIRGVAAAQMEDYLSWAAVLGRRIIPEAYVIYPHDDRSDIFVPRSLREKQPRDVQTRSDEQSARGGRH